jgi:hypothetical protein
MAACAGTSRLARVFGQWLCCKEMKRLLPQLYVRPVRMAFTSFNNWIVPADGPLLRLLRCGQRLFTWL